MTSELCYRECSAQKSVGGTDFQQGVMDFNFSTGAPTGWIPSRSYFRIEMTLKGAAGAQPTISQQLAFADSACGCLFDNIYFKGAGQDISTAVNYIAQSAALKNRLQKTGAWLASVGKSAYLLNSDFQERVVQVSSDDLLDVSSQQEYAAVGGDDGQGTVIISMPAGTVVGINTKLTLLSVGDLLVVGGQKFRVMVAATTDIGANMVVSPTLALTQTTNDRTILGFPAQNTVGYVATTGVITFAAGGGAVPPDVRVIFPIGSYFAFDGTAAAGTDNVLMEVIAHTSALIIGVRPVVAANVAVGAVDFQRVSGSASPVRITGLAGQVYGLNMKRSDGGQRNSVFALWQPPIGIFDHDGVLGAGDWRISLNPNSRYKTAAIQTKGRGTEAAALPSGVGTFDLEILNVKFYVATVKASIPQGISSLYLMESQIQSKPISGPDNQYEFTVPSSTRALTIFVQSNKAGSNPLFPPSMFKLQNEEDLKLKSLQITFANTTKPSTRWESSFGAGINKLQQRYNDSLQESGLLMSSGGAETFKDYLARGPIYHYSFTRDSEDKSTQVQVQLGFDAVNPANANIFLVSWYSRGIEITTHNGQIQEVRSLSV